MRLHLVTILIALSVSASGQGVRLNEIHTGADWIEVCNLSAAPVDISGWVLVYAEDLGNPAGSAFTFPGAPGSGTVVLAPNGCAVVSDSPTGVFPIVPPAVPLFYFGTNILWNSGEAGSVLLADASGDAVDYLAFGNPNLLSAPFEAGSILNGTPGSVTPFANPCPDFGTPNTSDLHRRHSRGDTDDGADWTMSAPSFATPGAINPLQQTSSPTTAQPAFAASTLSGVAPLTVHFTNLTTGGSELTLVTWDFDATTQPGVITSSDHNASFTFASPGTYDVLLSVADAQGATTSLPQTVTVFPPPTIVPVAQLPFVDRFEGMADPETGLTANAADGWEARALDPTSRIRTVDPHVTPGTPGSYGDATLTSQPTVVLFDSSVNTHFARNELVLHVDMVATGDFVMHASFLSNFDEPHPADRVFITDGVAAPVPILDWQGTLLAQQTWDVLSLSITSALLSSLGMAPTNDVQLIFSQADDHGYAGGDGLLLDEVILLSPSAPGGGQPCSVDACMDINAAINANGNGVGHPIDPNGPFFTTVSVGAPLAFTFTGEPNRPIILIEGPLNPGVRIVPGLGSMDVGVFSPLPPFFVMAFSVVVDGNSPLSGIIGQLFQTGPGGATTISFTMPVMPPGIFTTFQSLIGNSQTGFRFSNAVQVSVN